MPATAGRVRMPANNRVHSSAALQTHSIWENTIKHNPYAPKKDDSDSDSKTGNPYTNFQGLMSLARISVFNPDDSRGACKRCGRLGHLSFQCRNFLTVKEKEQDLMQQKPLLSGPEKIKEESESEEEEESKTSDSEVDSEIERIIAPRYGNGNGKKKSSKRRSSSRKKDVSDEDGSDSDSRGRKRVKSKKHTSQKKRGRSDSESEDEAKRKRRKKRKRSNKEKEEVKPKIFR